MHRRRGRRLNVQLKRSDFSMIRPMMTASLLLLCAACVETGGLDTLKTGSGMATAGDDDARGSIGRAGSGDYIFALRREDASCTAVFEGPETAGRSDLSDLRCTDGGRGTATVVYGSDLTPNQVVWAVNGSGGGNVRF